MTDERSPLLQNGRENDDYSAANEPEQADSVTIHESTDAEQQLEQTAVAPQNSVITLVRFSNFRDYIFYFNTDKGDTNGDRDILKCNGPDDYRGLCVTYSSTFLNLNYFLIAYASIGSELNELQNTSWIATSYLLTTTSIQ